MSVRRIRESEEMYLETILLLHRERANVRAVDVCEQLDFVKSSVSRGVHLLQKKGYIEIDPATGNITFTEAGRRKAEGVYERHLVIKQVLLRLGAGEETAETDACRIEHVISDDLLGVFKRYLSKEEA